MEKEFGKMRKGEEEVYSMLLFRSELCSLVYDTTFICGILNVNIIMF